MSIIEFDRNLERLIGASCHEIIHEVLKTNPEIAMLAFRKYYYIPQVIAKEKTKQDIAFELNCDENLRRNLEEEIKNLDFDQNLAIFSRVTLRNGSPAHIPMVDFRLSKSPENIALIRERMKKITGQNEGFILESDKSYHYYGLRILKSQDAWLEFIAKCLLTSIFQGEGKPFLEVADPRYIGHRLLEKGCALRVSANGGKVTIPKVVAVL